MRLTWDQIRQLAGDSQKALTLTQPWATLVMLGEKCVETRPVLYKHRGLLWIHASRNLDELAWASPYFQRALARHGITRPEQLPLGAVLGSVVVADGCRFTEALFPLCLPESWRSRVGEFEVGFGNYAAGRGGLLLTDRKPLPDPIPARGMNGLWDWKEAA